MIYLYLIVTFFVLYCVHYVRKFYLINKDQLYNKDGFDNEDAIFEKEDSLLIIINEKISDSIKTSIENMYLKPTYHLVEEIDLPFADFTFTFKFLIFFLKTSGKK